MPGARVSLLYRHNINQGSNLASFIADPDTLHDQYCIQSEAICHLTKVMNGFHERIFLAKMRNFLL